MNHEEADFVADDLSTHKAVSDLKPSPQLRRMAKDVYFLCVVAVFRKRIGS